MSEWEESLANEDGRPAVLVPASPVTRRPSRFHPKRPFTLGVEIELQLLDLGTLALAPRARELLAAAFHLPHVKPEFFQSMVEIATGVCSTAHCAASALEADVRMLDDAASGLGLGLGLTATHPFTLYPDCPLSPGDRYRELDDRHQWLTRRMVVQGLHVHVAMRSGDECIAFLNAFQSRLPLLMALSASSPFWQGQDTGLASCRPTMYSAMPSAGHPYELESWMQFEGLLDALARSGAITSHRDLWWDMRPSPGFGTLEIRACDAPGTVKECAAIVALIHLLALDIDRREPTRSAKRLPRWIARENKWRAIRYGLDAELVVDEQGHVVPVRELILGVMEDVEDLAAAEGYDGFLGAIDDVLAKGNSSERQRAVLKATGSFEAVVRHNIEELRSGGPIWSTRAAA